MKIRFLLLIFIINSCNVFKYSHHQPIIVHTTKPSKFVINSDTFITRKNRARIFANFNTASNSLYCITDSSNYTYEIKSIGKKYNISWLPWVKTKDSNHDGYLKYNYRFPNYIHIYNPQNIVTKRVPFIPKKSSLYLNIGLPYLNHLYIKNIGMYAKSRYGFIGQQIGFTYYTSLTHYNSTSLGFVSANPYPIGNVNYEGTYSDLIQWRITTSINSKHSQLHYGIGASINQNIFLQGYRFLGSGLLDSTIVIQKNNSLSLASHLSYQYTSGCLISIQYHPSVFIFSPRASLDYQHAISIAANFTILLHK